MWLQRFTNYVLERRWQTILLAFAITFIPVIGILGILIAALVTLCKDIFTGAMLTIAATLPYVISFFLTGNQGDNSPQVVVWAAVSVAIFSNLLTWIFAVMLKRQVSWSLILQIGALFGVLVVSVIHLTNPHIADWWGSQLQSYYSQVQAVAEALKSTPAVAATVAKSGTDTQLEMINTTKQYATGLMVAGILFNAVLQLIVARWWQATVFNPGNLRKELHQIRLSPLAGILFFISLVCSYLGNSVVSDIMPILYLLFGAAGLSLIHYLFGLMVSPTRWFWLLLVYVTLAISLPMSMMLVAFLALLDIWLDFRKRFNKV